MAGNLASSSLRDTQHIPKLNGDNHHEWSYEVLSIAEQHSLKDLLIAPNGGVLSTRPEPVSYHNSFDLTNLIFQNLCHCRVESAMLDSSYASIGSLSCM